MSDAPPPDRAERIAEGGLTPADIGGILGDFRGWLEELASGGRQPPGDSQHRGTDAPRSPDPIDLHTLVAQFTALRHDVNLQTKATRAAVEQTAKLIDGQPDDDALRPLVRVVIDIADALTTAHRQVEKARAAADPLLAGLTAPPPEPGLFARLFGTGSPRPGPAGQAADRLRPLLAGVVDGYAMSLRRVERVLPQFGLEPIPCVGRPFDPDTMEVVELGDGNTPGTVLDEVRRGYRWNGTVFRFAQVKVAR